MAGGKPPPPPLSPHEEGENSTSKPLLKPRFFIGEVPIFHKKPTYAEAITNSSDPPISFGTLASPNNFETKLSLFHKGFLHLKPLASHLGKCSVLFKKSDKVNLMARLNYVLVAKFSHGRPTVDSLHKFLLQSEIKGNYVISVFDLKHVFIEFAVFEDFSRIWLKRKWVIQGFPVRFFKWSDDFIFSKESSIVPVWVHLPRLPLYLFEEESLLSIANAIGKPLYIDKANLNRTKLGYASFCVEMDVSKTPLDDLWIEFEDECPSSKSDGFWQSIVYVDIPRFCVGCHHMGHKVDACKRRLAVETVTRELAVMEVGLNNEGAALQTKGRSMQTGSVDHGIKEGLLLMADEEATEQHPHKDLLDKGLVRDQKPSQGTCEQCTITSEFTSGNFLLLGSDGPTAGENGASYNHGITAAEGHAKTEGYAAATLEDGFFIEDVSLEEGEITEKDDLRVAVTVATASVLPATAVKSATAAVPSPISCEVAVNSAPQSGGGAGFSTEIADRDVFCNRKAEHQGAEHLLVGCGCGNCEDGLEQEKQQRGNCEDAMGQFERTASYRTGSDGAGKSAAGATGFAETAGPVLSAGTAGSVLDAEEVTGTGVTTGADGEPNAQTAESQSAATETGGTANALEVGAENQEESAADKGNYEECVEDEIGMDIGDTGAAGTVSNAAAEEAIETAGTDLKSAAAAGRSEVFSTTDQEQAARENTAQDVTGVELFDQKLLQYSCANSFEQSCRSANNQQSMVLQQPCNSTQQVLFQGTGEVEQKLVDEGLDNNCIRDTTQKIQNRSAVDGSLLGTPGNSHTASIPQKLSSAAAEFTPKWAVMVEELVEGQKLSAPVLVEKDTASYSKGEESLQQVYDRIKKMNRYNRTSSAQYVEKAEGCFKGIKQVEGMLVRAPTIGAVSDCAKVEARQCNDKKHAVLVEKKGGFIDYEKMKSILKRPSRRDRDDPLLKRKSTCDTNELGDFILPLEVDSEPSSPASRNSHFMDE